MRFGTDKAIIPFHQSLFGTLLRQGQKAFTYKKFGMWKAKSKTDFFSPFNPKSNHISHIHKVEAISRTTCALSRALKITS